MNLTYTVTTTTNSSGTSSYDYIFNDDTGAVDIKKMVCNLIDMFNFKIMNKPLVQVELPELIHVIVDTIPVNIDTVEPVDSTQTTDQPLIELVDQINPPEFYNGG